MIKTFLDTLYIFKGIVEQKCLTSCKCHHTFLVTVFVTIVTNRQPNCQLKMFIKPFDFKTESFFLIIDIFFFFFESFVVLLCELIQNN